jgi:hypothetical protein
MYWEINGSIKIQVKVGGTYKSIFLNTTSSSDKENKTI